MYKSIKISALLVFGICLYQLNTTTLTSLAAKLKPNVCQKDNKGIGNNYEIPIVLPTNSLNLNDTNNQAMLIRIDPDNEGQMTKLKNSLVELKFTSEQINFTISQIPDLEKRKNIKDKCLPDSTVDLDFTIILKD